MQSPAADASSALTAALDALQNPPPDPYAHAHAARRVSRLADDAELAALEARDPAERAALLSAVKFARREAAEARQTARERALSNARDALLPSSSDPAQQQPASSRNNGVKPSTSSSMSLSASTSTSTSTSAAADLAADINAALRRATAVITDEVARSHAAGAVLDDGTKRLSATTRKHARFSGAMRAGRKTMRALRASEVVANVAVVLSFVFFFAIAGHVTSRRVGSSTLVAVTVKPALAVVRAPVAAARALWLGVGAGRRAWGSRGRARETGPDASVRQQEQQLEDTGLREEGPAAQDRSGGGQRGHAAQAEAADGGGDGEAKCSAVDEGVAKQCT